MSHGTQKSARDHHIFVVFKSQPSVSGEELKSLLFGTEDPTIAYSERDRMNRERTATEQHNDLICFKLEKIPMLSRRRSRHPFMRGQQKEMFNPDEFEKDGNVNLDVVKPRGRIHTKTKTHV